MTAPDQLAALTSADLGHLSRPTLIAAVRQLAAELLDRRGPTEAALDPPLHPVAGHLFRQYRNGHPPRCACGAERVTAYYATAPHKAPEETP